MKYCNQHKWCNQQKPYKNKSYKLSEQKEKALREMMPHIKSTWGKYTLQLDVFNLSSWLKDRG